MGDDTDILLLTIDSLRADHVGDFGYDRETTPHLDSFATDAITFASAMSHGPTMFTSFPSMFTGHHALTQEGHPALEEQTIADTIRSAGYHTKAVVASNGWLSPVYGYDEGFDEFDALGIGPNAATTWRERIPHMIGDVLDEDGIVYRSLKRVRDWQRSIDDRTEEEVIHDSAVEHVTSEVQTFTWVHYMTTHHPYTVDPDEHGTFVDAPPDESFQRTVIERSRDLDDTVPEADRQRFEDTYDASIRHVDRRVGELLDAIYLDTTSVIVTADHGEGFWEHGFCEHTPQLYQELLHVPLWVRPAGGASGRVEDPVGLSAIPGTIEDLANLPGDRDSLLAIAYGRTDPPEVITAAVAHPSVTKPEDTGPENLRMAARRDRWKYISVADADEGDDELYDLDADPGETDDVIGTNPGTAEELAADLRRFRSTLSFSGFTEAPDEIRGQLKDLGYLE